MPTKRHLGTTKHTTTGRVRYKYLRSSRVLIVGTGWHKARASSIHADSDTEGLRPEQGQATDGRGMSRKYASGSGHGGNANLVSNANSAMVNQANVPGEWQNAKTGWAAKEHATLDNSASSSTESQPQAYVPGGRRKAETGDHERTAVLLWEIAKSIRTRRDRRRGKRLIRGPYAGTGRQMDRAHLIQWPANSGMRVSKQNRATNGRETSRRYASGSVSMERAGSEQGASSHMKEGWQSGPNRRRSAKTGRATDAYGGSASSDTHSSGRSNKIVVCMAKTINRQCGVQRGGERGQTKRTRTAIWTIRALPLEGGVVRPRWA